jgi:hypothetical protein
LKRIVMVAGMFIIAYVGFALHASLQITTAIREANAELLSEHIDFSSLRASLKEQIMANLLKDAFEDADKEDRISRFRAGLMATVGPPIVEKIIDNLVTPSGLSALLSRTIPISRTARAFPELKNMIQHLSIAGPTRLRLSGDNGVSASLTFQDWTWKITSIYLPAELLRRSIANLVARVDQKPGPSGFGPLRGLWRTPD